jgi:protein-S-isoprenylcysteine O-methyltransferase Ste14
MRFVYEYLFAAMWVVYFGYWWAKSKDVKATERQESGASRFSRMLLLIAVTLLLALPSIGIPILERAFLPNGVWRFWTGAAVTAAGLLFSVWARECLGKNWSQAVTVKQDHELITSGPYAVVRHPIYTGLLLAVLGGAVARGEWRGLLALAFAFVALWNKLRLEEKWMREHFGEAYEKYARRVAALVPYVM